MNAFTRSTIAAAERDVRRVIEALEDARRGDLTMLSSNVHKALVHSRMALEELDRAVRLDDGLDENGDEHV